MKKVIQFGDPLAETIILGKNKSWLGSVKLALRLVFYAPISFFYSVFAPTCAMTLSSLAVLVVSLLWFLNFTFRVFAGLCGYLVKNT